MGQENSSRRGSQTCRKYTLPGPVSRDRWQVGATLKAPHNVPDPIVGCCALRRAELPSDTVELARYLIGKIVVHEIGSGRFQRAHCRDRSSPVGDAAGHGDIGETNRNRSLFLKAGACLCIPVLWDIVPSGM